MEPCTGRQEGTAEGEKAVPVNLNYMPSCPYCEKATCNGRCQDPQRTVIEWFWYCYYAVRYWVFHQLLKIPAYRERANRKALEKVQQRDVEFVNPTLH